MIVPSHRLLLLAAIVVIPAATAAGLSPALFLPCCAILLAFVIVSAIDALRAAVSRN